MQTLCVLDFLKNVFFPSGVHLGGAGALIARRGGHIADDGHAGARFERKGRIVVLEQHACVFGDFAGHFVMCGGDIVFEQVITPNAEQFGGNRDFGDFRRTGVKIRFGQCSGSDGTFQLSHGSEARRRHFQRPTGLDCCDRGVGTAPVGNDHTVESPFVA